MSEATAIPYGLSSSFQATGCENANGPCVESCIPPAMSSRLPPRSRKARSRAASGALSESGVPATAITFTSGAITVSVSANPCKAYRPLSCSRNAAKLRRPRWAASSANSANAITGFAGWVRERMSEVTRYSRSFVCCTKGMVLTPSAKRTAIPRYPSFTCSSARPTTLNCTGGMARLWASRRAALSAEGSAMTSFTFPRPAAR